MLKNGRQIMRANTKAAEIDYVTRCVALLIVFIL